MPSMTVILLSLEENEFSLLCFHILIYCLTTGKSGAENSALPVETCEQSPCRKQPLKYQCTLSPIKFAEITTICISCLIQPTPLLVHRTNMKLRLVVTQAELKLKTSGVKILDIV